MKWIAALAVALVCATPALAADLDCQLGIIGGAIYGRSQHSASNGGDYTDTFDVNGKGAGAQFGCLAARNQLRYGAAADFMSTDATGNAQETEPNTNFRSETAFDWLATMRLIAGYQLDPRTLLYLTGGLAFSSVKIRVCRISGPFAGCSAASADVWGLAGGLGAQVRLSRRWSVNAEWLYFGFENKEFPTPATFGDRGGGVHPEAHVLRAGLNFHF